MKKGMHIGYAILEWVMEEQKKSYVMINTKIIIIIQNFEIKLECSIAPVPSFSREFQLNSSASRGNSIKIPTTTQEEKHLGVTHK
jgi:hypothetical protein